MKPLTRTGKKKYLTFFIIIIFSVLLAMASGIPAVFTRILFQIVLFCAQLLIVKSLLDDLYQEE